jgi:hypothetical protein
MKLTFVTLLATIVVLTACNTTNTKPIKRPINDFIKKFKVVELPFYFNGKNNDTSNMFLINKHTSDTLFYKTLDENKVYGCGLLPDTANYYTLLYFTQSETLYPILVTYSKDGEMISQTNLLVRGCGSDCGLSYCSSTASISKDLHIYAADTLKYEATCDKLGKFLPNSDSTFIYSKAGSISTTGTITMSEEKIERKKMR